MDWLVRWRVCLPAGDWGPAMELPWAQPVPCWAAAAGKLSGHLSITLRTSSLSHHLPAAAPQEQKMCEQLNVPCAIVAVPKSIDNDFLMVFMCGGMRAVVRGWAV